MSLGEEFDVRGLGDLLLPSPEDAPVRLRKGVVTAIASPTFTATIEGATTAIPNLIISKPFLTTLTVGATVWFLAAGPVYLLIHQAS